MMGFHDWEARSTAFPSIHSIPITSDLSGLNWMPTNSKYNDAILALYSIPCLDPASSRASSTYAIAVIAVACLLSEIVVRWQPRSSLVVCVSRSVSKIS